MEIRLVIPVLCAAVMAADATDPPKSMSDQDVQETIREFNRINKNDAGTELFVLATNFLLYIALVILTILMQRVYFPHTLPPDDHPSASNVVHAVGEAEDDEDDGEFGDFEEAGGMAMAKGGGGDGRRDASDGVVPLDEALGGGDGDGAGAGGLARSSKHANSDAFLSSMLDFNRYDTEKMTKKQVLQRLVVCALGLNVCFVACGILQERMLTQPYRGEYFTSSYGLVFLNRLGGFIISALLFYFTAPKPTDAIVYEFSFPSVSNMLSSWCQYEALKYVSFPTQMLFKCFKLAPIMLMGKCLGNKPYPPYDYAVAIMIGFGISVFMVSTEDMNFGLDSVGSPETWSGTLCGLMLLAFFLCFDSFTGQWQSRMFHKHEDLTPAHMMLMVNTFSLLFSFITLVHTKELTGFMEFVVRHPEMHGHVVVFSVANTIGQIFIFQTIRSFGAVIFAIVMNTRIILSILFSCVIYAHPVNSQGLFGLFIVFASVAYRIKRKTANGQLLKWQQHQSEGREWFQNVHEHMDM